MTNGTFGMPGMSGMPGMNNGAGMMPNNAPTGAPVAFVLDIPVDLTWQPFETTDALEMDGYYACRISRESPRNDGAKSAGLFITLEILDEDQRGKNLSKFLPDPRQQQKNVWFVWRGLIRSIVGSTEGAQQSFSYRPGVFTGQVCYIKTEPYVDGNETRTSVASFITKDEYDNAVKTGKHRWPSKPKASGMALPGGMPSAFPMGTGFPGAMGGPVPPSPQAAFAPAPAGAPMTAPQAAPVGFPQTAQQAAPQAAPMGFPQPQTLPQAAPLQGPPGFAGLQPGTVPQAMPQAGFAGFPQQPQQPQAPAPAGVGFPSVFPGQAPR